MHVARDARFDVGDEEPEDSRVASRGGRVGRERVERQDDVRRRQGGRRREGVTDVDVDAVQRAQDGRRRWRAATVAERGRGAVG